MDIVIEISQVIATSIFSIIALFFLTRMGGKRQIAQMSTFDYVNSITIGSIAAEMATNLEQWYRPFAALLIYGIATWGAHVLCYKSIAVREFISGRSTILMENGTIYKDELKRAAIDINVFLGQARINGFFDLNEIQSAQMETNGQVSFLPKSQNRPVTPEDMNLKPDPATTWYDLVLDGNLMMENLKNSGKDRTWLMTQLSRQGIGQISEVFYAACDKDDNFFACRGK